MVVFIIVVAGIMYLRRQGPKPTSNPGSIRNVSYNPRFSPPTVDVYEAEDGSAGNVDSVDDGDVDMNDKPVEKQMSALYDNDDAIYDTAGLTTSEPTVDENALYDMAGMTTTVDAAVDEATYDIATTTAKPPADPDSTQLITSI